MGNVKRPAPLRAPAQCTGTDAEGTIEGHQGDPSARHLPMLLSLNADCGGCCPEFRNFAMLEVTEIAPHFRPNRRLAERPANTPAFPDFRSSQPRPARRTSASPPLSSH